jgi:xanthine dehydrogenase accessory factor
MVSAQGKERVLRAPVSGTLHVHTAIGHRVNAGERVADVEGEVITASFSGVVRGLLPDGFVVQRGMKIGDLDPRADPAACRLVSDKALAIGGGVLEAVLARSVVEIKLVGP